MTKRLASNPNAEYLVTLIGCTHMLAFLRSHLPREGERLFCYRCREYRFYGALVGMYRSQCDRCKYTRSYGAARLTAQRRAAQHASEYPGHVLTVTLGEQLISTHTVTPTASELPNELGTLVPVASSGRSPILGAQQHTSGKRERTGAATKQPLDDC